MKVLFDNNLPDQLRKAFLDHEVTLCRELGWDRISNGELLRLAQVHGFEVMVTGDGKIYSQQSHVRRSIALVVLTGIARPQVLAVEADIVAAVVQSKAGGFIEIEIPRPHRRRRKAPSD